MVKEEIKAKIGKQETKERGVAVVNELPKQDVRVVVDKDDNEFDVLTKEEALTEILTKVRENHKILTS
jgi:hypothetical protein|tara:strand:- start:231 stop:434 length:204 start_codon:yes stop_codon:yes gene_type:complete